MPYERLHAIRDRFAPRDDSGCEREIEDAVVTDRTLRAAAEAVSGAELPLGVVGESTRTSERSDRVQTVTSPE